MSIFDTLLRLPATNWRFVNTQGVELSVGEIANIGATGGQIDIKNSATGEAARLIYGCTGAGGGAAVLPVDGSSTLWNNLSLPQGAVGRIAKGGLGLALGRDLPPADFEGFCTVLSLSGTGGAVIGQGLTTYFMGQSVVAYTAFQSIVALLTAPFAVPTGGLSAVVSAFASVSASSRAIGMWGGMQGAMGPSIGVMIYGGRMGILV